MLPLLASLLAVVAAGEWGVFVTDQQTATRSAARYDRGPRLRIHIARRGSKGWSNETSGGDWAVKSCQNAMIRSWMGVWSP